MHSLLRPFKYNIPFYSEFISEPLRYYGVLSVELKDSIGIPEGSIIESQFSEGSFDWESVMSALLKETQNRAERGTHHSLRDRWAEFSKHLLDPFNAFLSIIEIDRSLHFDVKRFSNPAFEDIFQEIVRDNIITEVEKAYLAEKVLEYGVDMEDFEDALSIVDPAIRSFRTFVSEVCRDGVVTKSEREFIVEKAHSYNLSANAVKVLLESELVKARDFLILRENERFYEIVVLCLLHDFVTRNQGQFSIITKLTLAKTERIQRVDLDNLFSGYLANEMPKFEKVVQNKIGQKLPNDLIGLSPLDWCSALGFNVIDHAEALAKGVVAPSLEEWHSPEFDIKLLSKDALSSGGSRIRFDGFDYVFALGTLDTGLFDYELSGTTVNVVLSLDHPLCSTTDLQSVCGLIMTLIAAKLMDDRIAIDDYFDALSHVHRRYSKRLDK